MQFTFTIFGNQEDRNGNPVPYHRQTDTSKWSKGAIRYRAWQDFVAKEYDKQVPIEFKRLLESRARRPIDLKTREAELDIIIEWADHKHGDGDNVFKGILDALFVNDKNVTAGSFKTRLRPKQGSVTVRLRVSEK